jgi:hypothetical protein
MAIFGRPDFQGDFNSLATGAPSWLGNPVAFLLSALQQNQGTTPGGGVPGILGGLGRGAPTGPATPAFGMPSTVLDPTGSSGITPSAPPAGGIGQPSRPIPPRTSAPTSAFQMPDLTQLPGMAGQPPQAEGGQPAGAPAFPQLSLPKLPTGGEPIGDPMSGLMPGQEAPSIVKALGGIKIPTPEMNLTGAEGGPSLPTGEEKGKEPVIKLPTGFGKLTGKTVLGEEPPQGMGDYLGDWTPTKPAEVPTEPAPPFNVKRQVKTGPVGPGAGTTIEIPGGGTAAPEARIKVTPEQREHMIRTVLGEAGDEPQKGKEAVAHVIINRSLQNKKEFGGSDVSAVVQKPFQFEPWNTEGGRARMYGYPTTSKDYKDAAKAVDDAISGKADPTRGATFFYAPVAQAALGRAKPSFATGETTKIGGHNFYYGVGAKPLPAPAGAEEGAVEEPMPAGTVDTSGRITPQPPQLPMPPGQAQTPRTDFSAVRAMLDKAGYITPGENMANVLAGLARGAGSVAANSPGSFAAALAAAGAGGEGAFASGLKEGRQAIGQRAAAEIPLLGVEREQAKDTTQVAYQNATAKYNTVVTNLNNDFTGRKQEFGFLQPDIKYDANGMHVVRYNPETGQYEATNVPLRDKMQQYEQFSNMIKALGKDDPLVRMAIGQQTLDSMPEDLRPGAVKMMAVQDVVSANAGEQVFGKAWTDALKKAEKQIPPELRSKPEVYDEERKSIAKSIILNDPSINNPSWLAAAAKSGSVWAGWMLQNLKPAKAATPAQPQEPYSGY